MKTKILLSTLVAFYFLLFPCEAQAPQKMSYQAVIRNTGNVLVANQAVGMRISILQGSPTGTEVYKETYSPNPQTNANGLVTIQIGSGIPLTGTFSAINWSAGPYFIKTETDPAGGTNYSITGTSQLLSVPYALLANNIGGSVPYMSVTGNTTTMDSALFVVRNNTGQIVFAVYNEGVRIYVDDGSKGTKGGFAIGGFGTAAYKGTSSQKYLFISKDSIRIYLNNLPEKATKGGFAIGGFDKSKGFASFLNVTPDSTRIFTGDTIKGFGVGNISTGLPVNYLKLSPTNYLIGHQAGSKITTGLYNSIMGYQSGTSLKTGSNNVFLGYQSGFTNNNGSDNVFLGSRAGYNSPNTFGNTLIGFQAGYNLIAVNDLGHEGSQNIMIGYQSGTNCTTGYQSVVMGTIAGQNWNSGSANVFIGFAAGAASNGSSTQNNEVYVGYGAGNRIISGDDNVFIGDRAGAQTYYGTGSVVIGGQANYEGNTGHYLNSNNNVFIGYGVASKNNGSNNTIIGQSAGSNNNGNNNVFLGYQSGANETGSNKLYIDNSATSSPLIWGDFSARVLNLNGNIGIGTATPGQKLDIIAGNGRVQTGYSWLTTSDVRYKKNIYTLEGCLEKVMEMRGVSFDLISDSLNFGTRSKNIGFIAQELENVVPEVVVTGSDGYKAVAYDKITAVLTEAIKDQQKQIEGQQKKIESARQENQQLRSELNELRTLVDTLVANQTGQGNK